MLHLQAGGFAPCPADQLGDLTLDPAEGFAPDPRYRLALPPSLWGRTCLPDIAGY